MIPLSAKCEFTPSGELLLTLFADANMLQFRPDGENLKADLEVGIADRAADGTARTNRSAVTAVVPMAKWEDARKQGITYQRQWKPAPGAKSLRVILHDVRNGKYGSLEVALDRIPR